MNKQIFERNLLALSKNDPVLCNRLTMAVTTKNIYRFLESRSGETIPALMEKDGSAHPLHSTVDPVREGERLVSTLSEEGYIVFLGLGGAFAAEAALKFGYTKKVLVVEYDCNGLAELLSSKDYCKLFQDQRFSLLADPDPEILEKYIIDNYIPAVNGGIRVFPLRVRTDADLRFNDAAEAVKNALDAVSRDYSVQAYFGKRWFSNIIRNLPLAQKQTSGISPIRKAVICAAGPSLEEQIPHIKELKANKKKQTESFIIATDTSLPVLLHSDVEPDAVVSIDCQNISYQHFFSILPKKTLLFLDLASPVLIASQTKNRIFFSGGHPLSLYICRLWRSLPVLDTSGANVTYTSLSLAENLGAKEYILFGNDFSYPLGKTYARGTYIYAFFEKKQSRYASIESQHSEFLYRDLSLKKNISKKNKWCYETDSLNFYREKVFQKEKALHESKTGNLALFSSGPARQSACSFLEQYKNSIKKLNSFDPLIYQEKNETAELLVTLLPLAAFYRRINPLYNTKELFNSIKTFCLEELEKINHSLNRRLYCI